LNAATSSLRHNFTGSEKIKETNNLKLQNGEMARSKNPAERSGFETCGSKTERGNRAAAGFCATAEVTEHVHRSSDRACLKKRGEIQQSESTSLSWSVSARKAK